MRLLEISSLEWAIKSILKLKDGDLFPIPFELMIIEDQKEFIIDELRKIHIVSYDWGNIRKLLIPKDEFTFRNASQLDPCDSIFLLAIIYEIGGKIELNRIEESENKVFSYRFKPEDNGIIYNNTDSWENFWKISIEKAKKAKFIFNTDIVDFYNQIYHHTIENMFTHCNIETEYKISLKNLLNTYTANRSSGIPIGPHPFHIIAEMAMIPIDKFLTDLGFNYCRYVDDFHFYCNSREDAILISYEFAKILNQNNLVMNRNKTKLVESEKFIDYAKKKEKKAINPNEKAIISAIKKVNSSEPYGFIEISNLSDKDLENFSHDNIKQIFDEYLSNKPVDFVRIRWLIRRLTQTGIPTAVNYFILNLEEFMPAFGDLFKYLTSVKDTYEDNWKDIGDILIQKINHKIIKSNQYLQMILLEIFSKVVDLNHIPKILQLFEKSSNEIKRKIILSALEAKSFSWLSIFKARIDDFDVWTKRAIIYASQVFPEEERKFWLKNINRKHYWKLIDKATIKYIKNL